MSNYYFIENYGVIGIGKTDKLVFYGFNLNIINDDNFLLPIITCGKYFIQGDQILLPISLQVHHAVCDGYHTSKFIEELQELADHWQDWLI